MMSTPVRAGGAGDFDHGNCRVAPWGEDCVKRATLCLVFMSGFACASPALAAGKDGADVLRVYADSVNPAEQTAYEAGIRKYNECLRGRGFRYAWIALSHETGDVYSYSYVTGPYAWADYDAMDAAAKPCLDTFHGEVNPHLKSEISGFFRMMPGASYLPGGFDMKAGFVDVMFFKLKPGHDAHEAFENAANKIAAAAAKAKWPVHFSVQRAMDLDRNAGDFVVLSTAGSWKDLGTIDDASAYELLESANGKADADATRAALDGAVVEVWSHIDRYNADLTYLPSK
jgi:hypothetical protein